MADWLDSLEQGATNVWDQFDLNKFIDTAAAAYKTIRQADQAPVTPGTTRRLADGSTVRVNADGSLTVVAPGGQARTIAAGGQVTAGKQWVPGIPNVVLLGAAALAAALFLMRR